MTRIESNTINTHLPTEQVYAFLSNLSNHEQIMPPEVTHWKVSGDACEYTIPGTGTVHLKVKERKENHLISLEPNGRVPFAFELIWRLEKKGDGCEVKAIMNADLNAILKMLAVAPLTKFINQQVENLNRVIHGA